MFFVLCVMMIDVKFVGCFFISCFEVYLKVLLSFIVFFEFLNIIWKCVEEYVLFLVIDIFYYYFLLFCIFSVGSGEGFNDLLFIGKLGEVYWDKVEKFYLFVCVIEFDKIKLEVFCVKGECLLENLK